MLETILWIFSQRFAQQSYSTNNNSINKPLHDHLTSLLPSQMIHFPASLVFLFSNCFESVEVFSALESEQQEPNKQASEDIKFKN